MRIVVTGATGFVGRSLVPLLAKGAELLLVGRDPQRLAALFPGQPTCTYDELETRGYGFNLLIHLAVVNNDVAAMQAEFDRVNIDLMLSTVEAARRAGIRKFLNISSFHALNDDNQTPYARSKRAAAERLAAVDGIDTLTVYLPAVHADGWRGKLSFLNKVPSFLARGLGSALAALKPTVEIATVADFVLRHGLAYEDREVAISEGQGGNFFYRFVMRTVDLAFALAVIVFLWWVLLIVWVTIRLQSPGPGILAQRRVGQNGEEFTCYKFRTMRMGTVQAATNQVSASAVTKLGHFLRRTKIDELPQVVNILRNEIGLIGPRPCLPVQDELIEERRIRGVLKLKPGISGFSQVNGIDMSDPVRLARSDARYAAMQCLLLDLKIMIATVIGKGGGDRVSS